MEKNSINIEEIAKLSRLDLGKDELDKYGQQLSEILIYTQKIQSYSATSGESSAFAEASADRSATPEESPGQVKVGIINGVTDVMREDEVGGSLPREQALKNAPAQKDGFIQVKGVFADGEQ